MTPIKNNILFKPFPPKDNINGIFVPESCREVRDKGTIEAVGAWVKELKKGDVVHRVHNWGEKFVIDNEVYFLMDAQAILAIE